MLEARQSVVITSGEKASGTDLTKSASMIFAFLFLVSSFCFLQTPKAKVAIQNKKAFLAELQFYFCENSVNSILSMQACQGQVFNNPETFILSFF